MNIQELVCRNSMRTGTYSAIDYILATLSIVLSFLISYTYLQMWNWFLYGQYM